MHPSWSGLSGSQGLLPCGAQVTEPLGRLNSLSFPRLHGFPAGCRKPGEMAGWEGSCAGMRSGLDVGQKTLNRHALHICMGT